MKGTEGFRIEGIFSGGNNEEEVIKCKWKAGKKEVFSNGAPYEKPNDHIGKFAAVMIAPDDMELINGGSDLRRKWMDGILSQTDRNYLEAILQYQRILLQRNAWLKLHSINPPFKNAELEFYNQQLSFFGSEIYNQRSVFILEFIPLFTNFYKQLSGGKESIGMTYVSDLQEKELPILLENSFQNDLRLQRTSKGLHKDDVLFGFNEMELKQFGSQGQKKSYLFALKLAQYAYLKNKQGHAPVLLLDDIFEKLDQQRMEALLRIIQSPEFGQVILSDTHPERIREAFGKNAALDFISL